MTMMTVAAAAAAFIQHLSINHHGNGVVWCGVVWW